MNAATVDDLLAIVGTRRRQVRRTTGVWVWTRSDGRLRARGFATSRFKPVPPHFTGRFVAGEPGRSTAGEPGRSTAGEPRGRLVGSIRESWLQLLVPRLFGFLAVVLILGDVAVVAGSFSVVGLLFCTGGAVALGWLAHLMGRARAGDFATGADELKRALTRLVPPASRPRSRRRARG